MKTRYVFVLLFLLGVSVFVFNYGMTHQGTLSDIELALYVFGSYLIIAGILITITILLLKRIFTRARI